MKKKPKQPTKENKSRTDLQKKKTLKQQNWNNLQKEKNLNPTYKKKKEIWTNLKKEKNPEPSYKKERTPKLIYKKEKRNWIFSQKKSAGLWNKKRDKYK